MGTQLNQEIGKRGKLGHGEPVDLSVDAETDAARGGDAAGAVQRRLETSGHPTQRVMRRRQAVDGDADVLHPRS